MCTQLFNISEIVLKSTVFSLVGAAACITFWTLGLLDLVHGNCLCPSVLCLILETVH